MRRQFAVFCLFFILIVSSIPTSFLFGRVVGEHDGVVDDGVDLTSDESQILGLNEIGFGDYLDVDGFEDYLEAVEAEILALEESGFGNSLDAVIDKVLSSGRLVFLYFYADWCHFCRLEKSIIDELESVYSGKIVFICLNEAKNKIALEEWGVTGFPTMFLVYGKAGSTYLYYDFRGFKDKAYLDSVIAQSIYGDFMQTSSRRGDGCDISIGGLFSHESCIFEECVDACIDKKKADLGELVTELAEAVMGCVDPTIMTTVVGCANAIATMDVNDWIGCALGILEKLKKIPGGVGCAYSIGHALADLLGAKQLGECLGECVYDPSSYGQVCQPGEERFVCIGDSFIGKQFCSSDCEWSHVPGSVSYCGWNKRCVMIGDGATCIPIDICEVEPSLPQCNNPYNPPPTPSWGPGGDNPDDNYDVSTFLSEQLILEDVPLQKSFKASTIAVLSRGSRFSVYGITQLLEMINQSYTLVSLNFLDYLKPTKYPVLIVPSGGLFGLGNSPSIRQSFESYVNRGGKVIVFSQQKGVDFSVLPGGKVKGYGWTEDQSCFLYSSGMSTYHPILSGQDPYNYQSRLPPQQWSWWRLSVHADGFFTNFPINSITLLTREKTGAPLMILYAYGKGYVLASGLYFDNLDVRWRTVDEVALFRDIVSWALAEETVETYAFSKDKELNITIRFRNPIVFSPSWPKFRRGDFVTIPVNVTNFGSVTANKVVFTLIDPNYEYRYVNFSVSIPPNGWRIVNLNYSTTSASSPGIWMVLYTLYNGAGKIWSGYHGAFTLDTDIDELSSFTAELTLIAPDVKWAKGYKPSMTVRKIENISFHASPSETVLINTTFTPNSLGIWRLEYRIKTLGNLTVETGAIYFAVSLYEMNPYGWTYSGNKISATVTTDREIYAKGENVIYTLHVWNRGEKAQNVTLVFGFAPYYYPFWGTYHYTGGIVVYPPPDPTKNVIINTTVDVGGYLNFSFVWPAFFDLFDLEFLPPYGNAERFSYLTVFNGTYGPIPVVGAEGYDVLAKSARAILYGGDYWSFIGWRGVHFDKQSYNVGDNVTVTLGILNSNPFNYTIPLKLEIKVYDPADELIFEEQKFLELSPAPYSQMIVNSTIQFSLPTTINLTALMFSRRPTMVYRIEAEMFAINNRYPQLEIFQGKVVQNFIVETWTGVRLTLDRADKTYGDREEMTMNFSFFNKLSDTITSVFRVSIPDIAFENVSTVIIPPYQDGLNLIMKATIPSSINSGAYPILVNFEIEKANRSYYFYVLPSMFTAEPEKFTYSLGEQISIEIINIGRSAAGYTYRLELYPIIGETIKLYEDSGLGHLQGGTKTTVRFMVPGNAVKGIYYLKVNIQNLNNLRNTSKTFMIYIEGLDAALRSETDKKVYSLNENITIKTEIKNLDGLIQDATLNLQISGKKPCVVPYDDMYINEDTVLCPGTYSIKDTGTQGVLIINASNIVLDCNGAVLNGIDKKGYGIISFGWNDNVTIKNCKIMNYDYGISLSYTHNNVIMNNEIQDMDYYGIYLSFSSSNLIYNNTLTNCYYGVYLARGDQNIALKNTLQSNRNSGIHIYTEEDDIIAKNTFINTHYGISFDAFSYWFWGTRVYYPNENITIAYNNITKSGEYGIWMQYTRSSLIFNNNIASSASYGIYITTSHSSNNLIINNTLEKNRLGIGIYNPETIPPTTPPTNNTIASNIVKNSTGHGIFLSGIKNTRVINNIVLYNAYGGIQIYLGANNTIIGNIVKSNKYRGIYLQGAANNHIIANNTVTGSQYGIYAEYKYAYPTNNAIYFNIIENNTHGIYAYDLVNSKIASNIIRKNLQDGITLYSNGNFIVNNTIALNRVGITVSASAANNRIYHNNFLNNTLKQVYDYGANIWDNGYPFGGNYWSDYTNVDQYKGSYQNETGSDGIWDHPYEIPYYRKDNYPFTKPNSWTPFSIPPFNVPNLNVTITVPNIPEDPSDPDPPGQGENGVIWERNININVVDKLSLNTFVGQLGITGKFYLTARLYSSSTQMIAWDTDTFYITESDIYLTMKTGKKIYKPNENITIYGEVTNKGSTAKNITLIIKKDNVQIYSESFTLAPKSSHPYTLITYSNLSFTLEGSVDGFAATEFIRIAEPQINITLIAPDIVGRKPFTATAETQNKGELPANLNVTINGHKYSLTIPANQTTLIQTKMSINTNTTLTVIITGDSQGLIQKEIIFGENIQLIVSPSSFYLEGIVDVPYNITNMGLVETTFNVTFRLNSITINKTVFLPVGASLTDALSFNLTKGKYLLSYWTPFQYGNATIIVETPAEFIVISLPENETFKLGQIATLTVTLKNIGGTAGSVQANMTVPGITEQTNSTFILPGREGKISFTFKVPEDLEEKYYKAFFEIEGEKYEVKLFVLGAKIAVNASLDKQLYEEGENATLTLNIENLRDMNLTLFSRVVFAGYEFIQYFNLTSYEIKKLNFSVPVVFNAGKLSYSIYLSSGRAIYINALYIYPKPPGSAGITLYTDKQVYEMGETATIYVNVTKQGILIITAPNLNINTTVSPGIHQFSFEIPKLKSGTYTIRYTFENYSSSYPIDVIGFSARIIGPELDKTTYSDGDIITITLLIDVNGNFEGLVKAWIFDPENKIIGEGETNHTFTTGENKVKISMMLNTNSTGLHAIAYVIYAYGSFIWLSSGSTYFKAEVTAQPDTKPPQIGYVDVTNALNENRPITVNEPIAINAIVTDNVKVEKVTLYYRKAGQQSYTKIVMTMCPGCIDTYNATIPASQVTTATIEFYINATDGTNYSTYPAANPTTNPRIINVNLYPKPVVLYTPTEITENSMKLSWTQSIDTNFKNYTIYRSSTSGSLGTAIHTITQKSTTSYTVTGLAANTTYYFTVRVYDAGGLYADSNQVSAKTLAATPTPPPPVNLPPAAVVLNPPTEITENSMKLSWTESVDTDFKNYTIYLSATAGNLGTKIYAITTRSTTSYTVTGLSANTTYYFTIRVYDTGGLCSDSNQVSARTLETQQPPPQPPPPPPAQFPWATLVIGVAAVALVIVIAVVIIRKRKGTRK